MTPCVGPLLAHHVTQRPWSCLSRFSFERATAFFLFGALQQFFFDGNKRSSRFMMNGVLMSHGIDAISVPAAKAQEFNEKMLRFYLSKNATEMMDFLAGCHPDAEAILPPPEEERSHDSGMET
ncbi:hypothetical protein [Acidithiobacillus marinus]|uniref:hypothetical protein n=1 Tax=Acidithiobacillus marinus TaxID=187490 RepID=UPI001C0EAC6B|nr:hypothetical protein [Acidithiobacillus marinus]